MIIVLFIGSLSLCFE